MSGFTSGILPFSGAVAAVVTSLVVSWIGVRRRGAERKKLIAKYRQVGSEITSELAVMRALVEDAEESLKCLIMRHPNVAVDAFAGALDDGVLESSRARLTELREAFDVQPLKTLGFLEVFLSALRQNRKLYEGAIAKLKDEDSAMRSFADIASSFDQKVELLRPRIREVGISTGDKIKFSLLEFGYSTLRIRDMTVTWTCKRDLLIDAHAKVDALIESCARSSSLVRVP